MSRSMGLHRILAAAALCLAAPAVAAAADGATPIPLDGVANINGVEAACTGVGQTREDPRWAAYPVRIEFSNARNEYLMGAVVSVTGKAGKPVLTALCDGPWLLLKLPKGRYSAFARLTDVQAKPRSAGFDAPASGQKRVVLQFLDQ